MLKDLKKEFPATIVLIVILLMGSYYLFHSSMETYPSFVHAWTQSDRLALAQNFQENGFNFFHPATYNLLTKDGITAVDFPIHDYLVAVIGKVFRTDLVSTFRYYNLIYFLIGLLFFFRMALLLKLSSKRAVFATVFVFTLPMIDYYANGFLPSIPSFSNFLIGLYFFNRYHFHQNKIHFTLAVLFITLAALSRATYLIFLIALCLQRILTAIQTKKWLRHEILSLLFAFLAFGGYYIYNQSLANQYGNMFLGELLYIDSWNTFKTIAATFFDRWGAAVLSPFQGIILLILFRKVLSQKNIFSKQIDYELLGLFIFSVFGVFFFFLAMGKQFAEHDYYLIDTFYPLLAVLILLLLKEVVIPKKWYTVVVTFCMIFSIYFFSYAKDSQINRYTPAYNDRIDYAYQIYKRARKDLIKWGVKPQDTLMVLDANSTNMPFTIWGNKGYTMLNSSKKHVKHALDSNFTYAVLMDSNFVNGSFYDYPDLMRRLEVVENNGELGLYKKSTTGKVANFFQHFQFYKTNNFNTNETQDTLFDISAKTEISDSAHQKSLFISENDEFPIALKTTLKPTTTNATLEIIVLADYQPIGDTAKIQLVFSSGDYYFSHYLENTITKVNKWQQHQYRFRLDGNLLEAGRNISIYYWNPNKGKMYIDNLKILAFQ